MVLSMKRLSDFSIQKKLFFYISIVLLIIVMIPLLVISHYGFMVADDFVFIQPSVDCWQANHSVFQVLRNQFYFAHDFYYTWQGTFSMAWLGSSMMVMIAENHYYLCTYISLVGMVASEFLFFMLVGVKGLGGDKYSTGIVSCWLIMLQVLMVPYPVEAFYWLCSSFLYTIGFNLSVLLYTLMFVYLRYLRAGSNSQKFKFGIVLFQVGIIILSFLIAFGNFVSAIFCFVSFLLIVLSTWIKKMQGRLLITLDSVIYTAFFVMEIIAPGNRARMVTSGASEIGAFKAVCKSIFAAAEYIIVNLYPTVFIVIIMMIPFIVGIVKNRACDKKQSFKYPLIFSIVTFGMYASQFVPTMYTLGILGAGRVINLYRFTLYIWIFSNLIYWIGWLIRHFHEEHAEVSIDVFEMKKSYLLSFFAVGFAVLCFSAYFYGGKTLTFASAIESLSSGQAQLYHEEYLERLEMLQDDTVEDAILKKFTDPPYLIYLDDISDDPDYWLNTLLAQHYGKNSVVVSD